MLKPVKNIGNFLTDVSLRFADLPGLIHGDRSYSWGTLNARVDALAHALRKLGIGKGDRILIHSSNNVQLFESCWATFKLGAIWVPTNVRITESEIAYLASASRASIVIYDDGYAGHANSCCNAADSVRHVISIGEPQEDEFSYEALQAQHRNDGRFEAVDVDYEDPLWFFFTSGTTGFPKAGVLSHGQMAFVITNHLADLLPGIDQHSRSLVVAPLSHGAGIHAIANTARGAASILPASARLDCAEAWQLVQQYGVDNMFTVPTIVKRLTEDPAVDQFDHSSLKYVIYAGAPMYREDQKHALRKLGKVLVQYYGLGEVTGNITVLPAHMHQLDDSAADARIGTCGYARTGMEIAILDEQGQRCDAGMTGEICVRGPAVCMGYDNNDAANEKAFRYGWFHTGDLGHLDEQGFLYITGRQSDMFISGGSNVYPREIEEALLTHTAVSEVAVFGVPDEKWGETGVAVVVCKSGCRTDAVALNRHLNGKVARYKYPTRYYFWDSMPKSGYGKIVKKDLRRMVQDDATA